MKIAISGAAGRIGRIYGLGLAKQGHEVGVYDTNLSELRRLYTGTSAVIHTNNMSLVKDADVVLLYVPVPKTREVLRQMSKYLKYDAIIGSAASSKEIVAEEELNLIPRYAPQARIVEFHPMHGEQTKNSDFPRNQNILTVPVKDYPVEGVTAESMIRGLFLPMEAVVRHVDSVKQHDEMMGEVQGGNHSIAFSRDTAWYLSNTDPDKSSVYADPLDDAKSLHARRPLGLNLQVYVVTMLLNRSVPPYVQQYEDVLSEIYKMVIEGRREELCSMLEEAREHLGSQAISDSREKLSGIYGKGLDDTPNSHISDFVWGEVYKRRDKRPTDFVEFESPHYAIGRTILCGVFGGDLERFVDNAMDNPETRWQDYNYGRAVSVINQIVQSGDDAALLRHFEKLKRFFNKGMIRDLDRVAEDSTALSKKLR